MNRKLRIAEYALLLEKISNRFRKWAVKALSFAGRTQLITSVIYGAINFWTSTFILPQGCLKKIESLCSRFLWSGCIDGSKGAKVAWKQVCMPKDEGGLGLRRISPWNKMLCLRLIWVLLSYNSSLWSRWQKLQHLTETSFWEIEESPSNSWTWRSLLQLRPLAKKFIRNIVGNGRKTSFWFDHWTTMGPLINLLSSAGPRSIGIPLKATVAEACHSSGWKLRNPRSEEAVTLHTYLTTVSLPSQTTTEDSIDWVVNGIRCSGFSTSKTWEVVRPRLDKKDWWDIVWYKGAVPKHAFHMWVCTLNRLPTRMRLHAWGDSNIMDCCLCSNMSESRDNLLLTCTFSAEIWTHVFIRLSPSEQFLTNWDELLSWQRRHTIQGIIFKNMDKDTRNIINSQHHRKHWSNLMSFWIR